MGPIHSINFRIFNRAIKTYNYRVRTVYLKVFSMVFLNTVAIARVRAGTIKADSQKEGPNLQQCIMQIIFVGDNE
jgi:hypothetical protein